MFQKFFPFITIFLFASCLKTADQIQKESKFDQATNEFNQSRSVVADLTMKTKEQQEQINRLNGKIEEISHGSRQSSEERELFQKSSQQFYQSLQEFKQKIETQDKEIQSLKIQIENQNEFIKDLTKTLEKLQVSKKSAPPAVAAKPSGSEYERGVAAFEKKNFKEAKRILEDLIAEGSLTNTKGNVARHHLGIIEYNQGNYENSIIHLSKIYPQWPKSSMAPAALYYIGLSLEKLGRKSDATTAFKTLKETYPNDEYAKKVNP